MIDSLVQQPQLQSQCTINFVTNDKATLHFANEEFPNIRMTKEEYRDLYCLDTAIQEWNQIGVVHKKVLLPTRLDEKFSQSVKTKSNLANKKERQTQDVHPSNKKQQQQPSAVKKEEKTNGSQNPKPVATPPTVSSHLKSLFELHPELKKINYSFTQAKLKNTTITTMQQYEQFRSEYAEKYPMYRLLVDVLEKNKVEFEKLHNMVDQETQPAIKEKLKKDMTELYNKRKDEVSKMTSTYLCLYAELEELKQLIYDFENK